AMNETSQQSPAASSAAGQLHQDAAAYPVSDTAQAARDAAQPTDSAKPGYDEGYRLGYQDGERDCQQAHSAVKATARPATPTYSTRSNRTYYTNPSYGRSGV